MNKTNSETILHIDNLTCVFGKFIAVNNVAIKIKHQELFGLLGPNGAGKSTLIKILTTLLKPTSGTALIDGIDILTYPRHVRSLIGYVPQLISADGALTGYENLMLFARLHNIPTKERKQRIMDALEIVGLTDVAHDLVKTYSGGMMRRLEIIQAMLHHPKILFLDEPTSGLDPIGRIAVWEYLKSAYRNFGTTIFLTTQDMEEADKLCSEIAIMDQGKIIVTGNPSVLKKTINMENATMDDVFIYYAKGKMSHA